VKSAVQLSSLMLELAVFYSSFIRLGCSLPAYLMVSQMVNLFYRVTTHKFIFCLMCLKQERKIQTPGQRNKPEESCCQRKQS